MMRPVLLIDLCVALSGPASLLGGESPDTFPDAHAPGSLVQVIDHLDDLRQRDSATSDPAARAQLQAQMQAQLQRLDLLDQWLEPASLGNASMYVPSSRPPTLN